jgi:hypothetical protein
MKDRGYPTEGYEQTLADLSVEHANTLDHYRQAHEASLQAEGGKVSTEDLRLAMLHYRALFSDLLGRPGEAGSAPGAGNEPAAPAEYDPPASVVGGGGTSPASEPGTGSGLPADAQPIVPPGTGPAR